MNPILYLALPILAGLMGGILIGILFRRELSADSAAAIGSLISLGLTAFVYWRVSQTLWLTFLVLMPALWIVPLSVSFILPWLLIRFVAGKFAKIPRARQTGSLAATGSILVFLALLATVVLRTQEKRSTRMEAAANAVETDRIQSRKAEEGNVVGYIPKLVRALPGGEKVSALGISSDRKIWLQVDGMESSAFIWDAESQEWRRTEEQAQPQPEKNGAFSDGAGELGLTPEMYARFTPVRNFLLPERAFLQVADKKSSGRTRIFIYGRNRERPRGLMAGIGGPEGVTPSCFSFAASESIVAFSTCDGVYALRGRL